MTARPITAAALGFVAGTALVTPPDACGQDVPVPPRRAFPVPNPPPGGGGANDTPSSGGDYEINWFTYDGGGVFATGSDYEIQGTFGQHDAGAMTGACFEVQGGYWGIVVPPRCYANCDNSTQAPVLNVADFTCFLQRYAQGDCYANCDDSTTPPILNVADFTCFIQKYALGCS